MRTNRGVQRSRERRELPALKPSDKTAWCGAVWLLDLTFLPLTRRDAGRNVKSPAPHAFPMTLNHRPRRPGRACPGHPRLNRRQQQEKAWLPAPSAGMTTSKQWINSTGNGSRAAIGIDDYACKLQTDKADRLPSGGSTFCLFVRRNNPAAGRTAALELPDRQPTSGPRLDSDQCLRVPLHYNGCPSRGVEMASPDQWQPISTAPFDRDLELAVIDVDGPHALVFPCRRALHGWIKASTRHEIDVHPTHWRDWRQSAGGRI